MENIIITQRVGYKELKPKGRFRITTYVEGDNISNYESYRQVDIPDGVSLDKYHSITTEQDQSYQDLRDKALEKDSPYRIP